MALHYLRIYADETHAVDGGGTDSKAATPCSPLQPGMITKEDVLERYTNVFRPGRGKPLGSPLHIEMDPDVTPVTPRHRVPVAKLDRVNDELKRLCDDGIIKPVTEPTEWLSNIPVKEKPNMHRPKSDDQQGNKKTDLHHPNNRREATTIDKGESIH